MTKLAKSLRKTMLFGEKTKNIVAERISKQIEKEPKRLYELTEVASKLGILDKIYLSVSDAEFKRIKSLLTTSDDSYLQHFSIEVDNYSYSICIYCMDTDNYTMHIDEAVKRVRKDWVNIRFSESQKNELDKMLDDVYKEIEQEEESERFESELNNVEDWET